MVCIGNICRSPMAEGILQYKSWQAGLQWSVESAGTNGQTGAAPHPLSQKVTKQKGIDISRQRARKFEAQDFDHYDKIYAMSEDVLEGMKNIARNKFDDKKAELLLNELFPGENLEVPDPWYSPEQEYHRVYRIIDEACEKIIEKYSITSIQNTTFRGNNNQQAPGNP